MENVLNSLSLPQGMDAQVRALAQKRGQTKNSLIQEALRDYLQRQEIEAIEKKMQARARFMGIETDDDVVKLVHSARKKTK